jgi:hypothetical protein
VICGTRGVPGTVAPFRAWRGSRDLVAQSPKFHAPAVAPHSAQLQTKILAQRCELEQSRRQTSPAHPNQFFATASAVPPEKHLQNFVDTNSKSSILDADGFPPPSAPVQAGVR